MVSMERLNVTILPAGAFGMAMAMPFLANGNEVTLGFRNWEKAEQFRATRQSERLPEVTFPKNLKVTANLEQAVGSADLVVVVTPSRFLRPFYSEWITPYRKKDALLLSVIKGVEEDTNLRPSEVIVNLDPEIAPNLAVLGGPNFAIDLAMGLPAATVIASECSKTAEKIAEACHSKAFRVYRGNDVVGVELGGALKNVIAFAAGVSDGLRKGESARAGLIQRGVIEMTRLGCTLGGREETLMGLSGSGDLWMTATSYKSRNHWAGVELALGKPLEEIINSGKTIEGIHTAKVAVELARQNDVEVPISDAVYQVAYNGILVEEAITQLLGRTPAYENGSMQFKLLTD